jgi:hypothetical protein
MPKYSLMGFYNSKRTLIISPSAITFLIVPLLGFLAAFLVLPLAFASTAMQGTYTTNFPLTEIPISEGGKWINGGTVGLDWTNVQTTPEMAFGSETGTNSGSAIYDDSTAVLAGTWGADQTAQATLYVIPHVQGSSEEVELRLRTSISAHSITGYEVNFAVGPGQTYTDIVKWNGALGNFTVLSHQNTGGGVNNGDTIKATIAGNVITVFKNGVQVNTATDSTYAAGNPGMGFYLRGSAANSDYGLANFSASSTSTTLTSSSTSTSSTSTSSTSASSTTPNASTSSGASATYTTNFSLTENPISEQGVWVNGQTVGLVWKDVRTTAGFAFGTQSGANPPPYNDSTAILTGTWATDQTASATVHLLNPTDHSQEEVEIRLRSSMTANSSTGYEFQFGGNKVTPSLCYADIVRWNGPLNSFASLSYSTGSQFCLHDGDTVKATAIGNTLTEYINGVQVKQVTDGNIGATYCSTHKCNPGIGFYLENDSGSPSNSDFGFSSFAATGGSTSNAPAPPTNLSFTVN